MKWDEGVNNGLGILKYTLYAQSTIGDTKEYASTTKVADTKGPALTYTYKATAGVYYFKIASNSDIGMGKQSTAGIKMVIAAPPTAPLELAQTVVATVAFSKTSVKLTWKAPTTATGISGYTIQWSANANSYTAKPTWAAKAVLVVTTKTEYVDAAPGSVLDTAMGGQLYYRVRADGKSGTNVIYGPWSNTAVAFACAKPDKTTMTAQSAGVVLDFSLS